MTSNDELGIAVTDEELEFAETVTVCGGHDTKWNTLNLAKRCIANNILGDFVECGVHDGGQGAMMARALQHDTRGRRIHLFDSWECQPMAGPRDEEAYREQLGVNYDPSVGKPSGIFPSSLEHCQENLASWGASLDRIVFHKGWLQEVLPKLGEFTPIALLRVDVDLYDSTVPVFAHLWDRVSPGGYIISDDWGAGEHDACRDAVHEFYDARRLSRPTVTRLPQTRGTVWWQKL